MKKLKVMTVIGTRPEIIRLSQVIKKLDEQNNIAHILVHTGQNYDFELNQIFFDDLSLRKPNEFLNSAEESTVKTIGNILTKMDDILKKYHPDIFLVLGDTNSALSSIAAQKNNIPIFHMEAGNRSFDARVPEEINRKIVDHIANINLPYSDIAREYLISEGIPADTIIKTGSPMNEVLFKSKERINNSKILNKLSLKPKKFFLISVHREENLKEEQFNNLVITLNALAEKYKLPVVVSTHPRTMKLIDKFHIKFNKLISLIKPVSFSDYNRLQMNALVVLSDSGTISEEASILKFRALNIRYSHERPEAMEETSVMMVGLEYNKILIAIEVLLNSDFKPNNVKDYMTENVSDKVLRILISYYDYYRKNNLK